MPRLAGRLENRLGLIFYVDTNFVGDNSDACERLRQLHKDGWIALQRTDDVDTELGDAKDLEKRRRLLDESAEYSEAFGPVIADHSRIGHSVFGNEDDEARLDRVYKILFPDSDRADTTVNRARHKLHDAMHLATAIRYGATSNGGFVTRDERDILRKRGALAEAFHGFRVFLPEEALAFALRLLRRYEIRNAGAPETGMTVSNQ